MAADADRDGYADDNQECEPVLIADGDRRHADGCDDPNCEEIDAPGRSELSWPCWVVWSDETYDWSDECERADVTPIREEFDDIAVKHALVE